MIIRKTFDIEVKETRQNGGQIVISTGSVDRDRDRVMPTGVALDNYLKNPVVQWGHNYRDPWATVGKSNNINQVQNGLAADFDLRPAANDQDPQNVVLLLWNGGWVRTASIGFQPIKWVENELGGRDFTEWELLEWSLVPVPANQEALRLAAKSFPEVDMDRITKRGRVLSAANEQRIRDAVTALEEVLDQLEDAPVEEGATAPRGKVGVLFNAAEMAEAGQRAEGEASSGDVAWIRRLEVDAYEGQQVVFACFHKYDVTIPEDATKLDFDEEGEIVEVPDPDAGKTFARKEVSFVPPIGYWDGEWGKDAVYSISGPDQPDESLVKAMDGEYDVRLLSEVLLSLPKTKGKGKRVDGTGICRMTKSRVERVKRIGQKMLKRSKGIVAKAAIPYKKLPLASRDAPWDGPAQMRDADPATLKIICAWFDAEAPDVKQSYKLPHHLAAGEHQTVWRGVTAAMGALLGARGGMNIPDGDRRGVYNHLASHYKDFEETAPDFKEYSEDELKALFPDLYQDQDEAIIDDAQPQGDDNKELSEAEETALAVAMGKWLGEAKKLI